MDQIFVTAFSEYPNFTLAKKQNSVLKSRFWTDLDRFKNFWPGPKSICTYRRTWPKLSVELLHGKFYVPFFEFMILKSSFESLFSKGSWIESPVVLEFYFETVGSFRVLSRLCLLWKGIQKLRLFIDRGTLKRKKFKVLLKNIQLHNFI